MRYKRVDFSTSCILSLSLGRLAPHRAGCAAALAEGLGGPVVKCAERFILRCHGQQTNKQQRQRTERCPTAKLKATFSHRTIPEARSRLVRKLGFDYANIPAILAFRKLIDELQPDIVHFHSFYGLSSYLVKVASRKAAVVVTLHDTWCSFIDGALVTPKFGLANAYWKIPFGLLHRRINQFCFENATGL